MNQPAPEVPIEAPRPAIAIGRWLGSFRALTRGEQCARVAEAGLVLVGVFWCVMRFVALETVPLGLSTDETLGGLHVQCLAETGKSADGQPWPGWATGFGGGLYSPTYLYTLFAWTRVFGISVSSLRGLSAAFSILAIVGLGFLGRLLADRRAARLAMIAGALSPWSFQVSRLAVDAPMTPALVVWGAYLFLRSRRAVWAAASGVVFAIACYTYSPTRVQVVLTALLLLVLERKRLDWRRVAAFIVSPIVVGLPLAVRILDGSLLGRARALSIFSLDYIEGHRGKLTRATFVVKQILENLFEHLRPSYLFFTGDANIRHSTQVVGELGWLDIFALACAALALGALIWRAYRNPTTVTGPASPAARPSRNWLVAGGAVLACIFGVLPAALCWEGLPHSLRSMSAWPAVSLFTGVVLAAVWSTRSPLVPVAALVLALAQTVHFFPYYLHTYPRESYGAWDSALREAADSKDPARFAAQARAYDQLGFRYYLMLDFGMSCESSQVRAQQIIQGK